jgi:hypothetical protein
VTIRFPESNRKFIERGKIDTLTHNYMTDSFLGLVKITFSMKTFKMGDILTALTSNEDYDVIHLYLPHKGI